MAVKGSSSATALPLPPIVAAVAVIAVTMVYTFLSTGGGSGGGSGGDNSDDHERNINANEEDSGDSDAVFDRGGIKTGKKEEHDDDHPTTTGPGQKDRGALTAGSSARYNNRLEDPWPENPVCETTTAEGKRNTASSSAGNNARQNKQLEDPWLKFEHQLCVKVPPVPPRSHHRKKNGIFRELNDQDLSIPLSERLDEAFANNICIADPYGVGDAMPPSSDWIKWALNLAENYPDRIKKLNDEFEKGCECNKDILDALENETREGYSGSRTYICAVNYSLHDAFSRCSLPLPPGMNFDIAVDLRDGEELYKAQMRSWGGYQMRVFGVIGIISQGHSSVKLLEHGSLPEVIPAQQLKRMPSQVVRYLKRCLGNINESTYSFQSDEFDESEFY